MNNRDRYEIIATIIEQVISYPKLQYLRLKTFTEKKTLKGTVNQVTIQRASEKRLN
jgi:hypothetical protein